MLLICNDLSTQYGPVKEAVDKKDGAFIADIAESAKKQGFEYLELFAGGAEGDEAENLLFMIVSADVAGLKYVLRVKDTAVYKTVLDKVKTPALLAPEDLTLQNAKDFFPLLSKLDEGWTLLISHVFGDDAVHDEFEEFNNFIHDAQLEGIMPERLYIAPQTAPLASNPNSFTKLRRLIDAFKNIYPEIKFYTDVQAIADSAQGEETLIETFIGMAAMAGIDAASMGSKEHGQIGAALAANAILGEEGAFEAYEVFKEAEYK